MWNSGFKTYVHFQWNPIKYQSFKIYDIIFKYFNRISNSVYVKDSPLRSSVWFIYDALKDGPFRNQMQTDRQTDSQTDRQNTENITSHNKNERDKC